MRYWCCDRFWSTFGLALASGLLLWASFPPLSWWPLAWLAPIGWLILIRQKGLEGWRPYVMIWVTAFIYHLLLFQWIRLPHWSAYFGWVALAFYLAFYLPVFVALSRVAVHRFNLSIIVAAPVVWTGLELARGYLLTGFSVALLGHTQVCWTTIIQLAEVVGAYGVSFLVILVATCLTRILPHGNSKWTVWPVAPLLVSVLAAWLYGYFALTSRPLQNRAAPNARVALIQGCIDVSFEQNQINETLRQYLDLSLQAVAGSPDVDVILWPESMFSHMATLVTLDPEVEISETDGQDIDRAQELFRKRLVNFAARHHERRAGETDASPEYSGARPWFILCAETWHLADQNDRYNSAMLIQPDGVLAGRYNKMHRVMFGEYVPFGDIFPWLYRLTPMPGGLVAGREPVVFEINGVLISPSICFESTVPQLIRRHVADLRRQGREPDVLVNLTNDGWFWGSSGLDMHLVCGVLRAVENRKPMLIAANTGFSAHIDSCGRIIQRGPRRAQDIIVADVSVDGRYSLYSRWGDWFAGICLVGCVWLILVGLVGRWRH